MEPFEIMISESQERMLCVVEPERVDDVLAVCARWEVNATAIGEVTDSRRLRVLVGERGGRRHARRGAGRRVPGLRPRAGAAGRPAVPGAGRACWPTSAGAGATLLALLGSPNLASRRLGLRAVRLPRRLAHRAPARRGRRRRARARRPGAAAALAVSIDGNGRRVAVRSLPRRGRGGARVRGQPGLRGRRAARADELPELRQPGEAAHRLAAHARRGRPGRRVPRARRCRSWAATSRSTTRAAEGPIYPTPVVGMVGELPDAARAGGLGFAQAGDAVALIAARSLGAVARRLRAGEAARPAAGGRAAPRRSRRAARGPRRGPPGRARRARCARPTTWPRAGSPSRWPSAAWPAGIGAEVDAGRGGGRPEALCSARARARSWSPARARRSPPSAPRRRCSARWAGTRCVAGAPACWRCRSPSSPARTRRARRADALSYAVSSAAISSNTAT